MKLPLTLLALLSPHTPLEAPVTLIAKHVARRFKRADGDEGKSSERPIANYLAMLEHLDNEVGRLLGKLDELKLSDRTVVIFSSDNGGLSRVTNNAPLREGKGSPYEGGIREGDWKLIHWFGDYLDTKGFTPDDKPYGKLVVGPRTELYNLREDLRETRDLFTERPKKTAHLTNALLAWLKSTGAKLPEKNPNFEVKKRWTGGSESSEGAK